MLPPAPPLLFLPPGMSRPIDPLIMGLAMVPLLLTVCTDAVLDRSEGSAGRWSDMVAVVDGGRKASGWRNEARGARGSQCENDDDDAEDIDDDEEVPDGPDAPNVLARIGPARDTAEEAAMDAANEAGPAECVAVALNRCGTCGAAVKLARRGRTPVLARRPAAMV